MSFKATINNKCSKDVERNCVKLIRTVLFHGKGSFEIPKMNNSYKITTLEQEIVNLKIDKLVAKNTFEHITSDKPLIIPPTCPTEYGLCDIISFSYAFVFTFACKNSIDKDLIIPVIIGTVPLYSDGSNKQANYSEASLSSN